MSISLGLLYSVLVWLYVTWLPGYVTSRLLVPDARGAARHGLALFCAFSIVPLAVFLLTVALSAPIDAWTLLIVATAINGGGAYVIWRQGGLADPQIGRLDTALVVALFIAVAAWLAFFIRSLDGGDVFSTTQHCLYVIVLHTVQNDPSQALPLYDAASDGLIHFLIQHPTTELNGLAPLFYEQRLGNAAILAPAVALFGTTGWFVTAAFATTTTGVCLYNAARLLRAGPAAAAAGALAFALGSRVFALYFVNENNYATTLVAFLLWLSLQARLTRGRVALLGLAAGHLIGVRYTSALFWPALVVAMIWTDDRARRTASLLLAGVVAFLATAPWLYVNFIMLGSPLAHPKVNSDFASRMVQNHFAGHAFRFRALNWPFIDAISRTAWNPFPTFLWFPLWVARSFGGLLMAVAGLGWLAALKKRRALIIMLLFAVPHSAALGLMESLDWEQLSYFTPGLVPLGVALALGLDALLQTPRRSLIVGSALLAMTLGGVRLARETHWPVDTRLLSPTDWPTPPTEDRGVQAVAQDLTGLHLFPRIPPFRTAFAAHTLSAMAYAAAPRVAAEPESGTWSYPSGRLAVLVGYSAADANRYLFRIDGRAPQPPDAAVRTGIGLHQISLLLPTDQIEVTARHHDGDWSIDIEELGDSSEPHDFTFYLAPWNPAPKRIDLSLQRADPRGVRQLQYGGLREFDEQRLLVTNYPEPAFEMIDLPFTVDLAGEAAHCGLFVFFGDVDETQYDTLELAGGHAESWDGRQSGVLRVPRRMAAKQVLLFSEPYCSDHVPQPGDRYGVVSGPFLPNIPLHFKLDRMW